MVALAKSITECPDIERIWHVERSTNNSVNVATGSFLLSHSDVGPYIHIICPEGSHVVGPNMITCLEGGSWDDVTEPSCSTSSLYGIAQSDVVLIGVLAGCGAIIILALTIILAHLLCFRRDNIHSERSADELERNSDSPQTASMFDDKLFHSISAPTSATLNGRQLTRLSHSNTHSGVRTPNYDTRSLSSSVIMACNPDSHEYSLPRYYLQSTRQLEYPYPHAHETEHVYTDPYAHAQLTALPTEDDNVFVNEAFAEEFPPRDYRANWENDMNSRQARSLHPISALPVYSSDNRTTF